MRVFVKTIVGLLLVSAGVVQAQEATDAGQVKLLTIGNSFANDATAYLPGLANAGGKDLLLFRANLGGCTFERHVRHLKAFEANPDDPEGRPYRGGFTRSVEDPAPPEIASGGNEADPKEVEKPKNVSLREALEAEKWDYVTIQQVSNLSFQFETFEPYAGTLIDYVKKYAPTAEIVIHQTWAYREDSPLFKKGLNQKTMFEGLVAAYGKLAEKYDLRVIPVGTAIQEARKLPRWTFNYPDPNFNYKEPVEGTKPDQSGSLMVGWTVRKVAGKPVEGSTEPPPSKLVANLDFKHCNAEGRYLGASVFYGFLFGEKVEPVDFVPQGVDGEDAKVLRGIADVVVAKVPAAVKP